MIKHNILYIASYDRPYGASQRSFTFASELASKGHSVTFVTNSYDHFSKSFTTLLPFKIEYIDNVKVVWLFSFPYGYSNILRFISALFSIFFVLITHFFYCFKPSVIFSTSVPPFTFISSYILSFFYKSKLFFEVRDVWPEELISLGHIKKKSFSARFLSLVSNFAYKNATSIISALPNVSSVIHPVSPNVPITYVPNPLDFDFIEKISFSDDPYQNLRSSFDYFCIYSGGAQISQDINQIINVSLNFPNVAFFVLGLPNARLIDLQMTLDQKNLFLMPFLPKVKALEYIKFSDLALTCVTDTDIFKFGINSNKIYDYMSLSIPIVFCGNAPSNPVELSGCGFCISPEDPEAFFVTLSHFFSLSYHEKCRMGRKGLDYSKSNFNKSYLSDKIQTLF